LIALTEEAPLTRTQNIYLEDSPLASNSIEKIATLRGPGLLLEAYQKEDMTIFVLLNHAETVMRYVTLNIERGIDFGTIQSMTSTTRCTTFNWEGGETTITYEGGLGTPITIALC
jgi:hypothetical protein